MRFVFPRNKPLLTGLLAGAIPSLLSGAAFAGYIYFTPGASPASAAWPVPAFAAGVVLAGLLLSWLIRGRLQALAAGPEGLARELEIALADETRRRRVPFGRGGEAAGLIEAINRLLEEAEAQKEELLAARADLKAQAEERARALQEAREEADIEKARLKFIFESAPVGISMFSWRGGDFKSEYFINDAHLRICGLTREQVMEDNGIFRRISHPDDLAKQDALRRRLDTGEIAGFSLEKRYFRPDGRLVWVSFSTVRNDYADGRMEALTTVVDITDLKAAQEAAAREQARLKFIFESVPVGISLYSWRAKQPGNSFLINDAHLRICGVTREQVMADPKIFKRISHPDNTNEQAVLQARMEAREITEYTIEKRYLRPDGQTVWVAFSTMRNDYPDGRVEALTTVVDITDLKKAQEATVRERERLKFIFDSVPVGISLFSKSNERGGDSFIVNDAQLRIAGISREQVMADPNLFHALTYPDDLARQEPLRLALRTREIDRYSLEKRYLRPDGKTVWVAFSTERKTYPDGRSETLTTVVDITDVKKAQEDIAVSQARLKFIFDSVPVGISLYSGFGADFAQSFLINDAHLKICGVTREQVMADGAIFGRISHPDDYARQIPLNRALAEGRIESFSLEKRYLRPDGRVVWVVFSAQRNHYPDGRVETLGTVVDITELKRAQEEATREKARFKFIFESLPVGVSWRLLGKDNQLLVNPAHVAITGVSAAAALEYDAFARATHPDDYERQRVLINRLNRGEIDHFVLEKRYLHPDGRVVWVVLMSRVSVDAETGEQQSVTTLVDITDLKRAQEEATREKARFKFIFESLPVGVAWMMKNSRDTRIVNDSFVRITGVPMEYCQEMERYGQATHPEDLPRQQALYDRMEGGEMNQFTMEKRYCHPDGAVCWTSYTLRFLKDPVTGEIQELTTVVDITERKKAEEELEGIHKKLVETSRQAGMAEVATSVLHNVGNVLNSVNVSATVMADHIRRSKAANVGRVAGLLASHASDLPDYLTNDPKGKIIPSYLSGLAGAIAAEQAAITGELAGLQKNIDHIKDIVAMQQNYAKTSGVLETLAVPDLVEDALRMNAGSLASHEIKIVRDYAIRPTLTLEKHKVLQILVNLIRNAQHACDESGRPDKRITLRTTARGGCVGIAVSDNGVGILAENLVRIFSHGFTTRANGHGFGLHSGALAAKELGGALLVHSDGPGLGATFTLELPLG